MATPDTAGTRHEFVVEVDDAPRLDLLVSARVGVSRSRAATLVSTGGVLVDGARERASFRAPRGARIEVVVPPTPGREVIPESLPVSVVFEDEHLIVVDKAAGMVVHPAPGNWTGTLVNALKGRGMALADGDATERQGLVHRLDKDTSGLMVVAKTDQALRVLSKAIAERRVMRRYAALCWGHLAEETVSVDRPISRDPNDRLRMAVVESGRAARTDFVRLARFASTDLLRCHLHSGRTHQIRVHLASIGHPVVGDDTYGGGGARKVVGLPPQRHFLHAAWLVFNHPVSGELLDFRSPLPDALRACLETVAELPDLIAAPNPLEYLHFYRAER
ncbi:MAG: RluA family pseudouridine synthase [Gemmatimonadetes bacterium]|nr:RluA family pseudouridine synthase [Gemmatimonadota bacterium]